VKLKRTTKYKKKFGISYIVVTKILFKHKICNSNETNKEILEIIHFYKVYGNSLEMVKNKEINANLLDDRSSFKQLKGLLM
jgi:hypothetical protein